MISELKGNMHLLLVLLGALVSQNPFYDLEGKWLLRSYDAIDKIRSSPAYLFGDNDAKRALEKQFEEILAKGEYSFGTDTLRYTDLEGGTVVYRRALWHMKEQVLYIDELDRPYHRQAMIHKASKDSLVLSPIIDGVAADSKMRFIRQ